MLLRETHNDVNTYVYNRTGHRLKGGKRQMHIITPKMGQIYPTTRDILQSHASVMSTSSYRYQQIQAVTLVTTRMRQSLSPATLLLDHDLNTRGWTPSI